jgi:hypothetical protein
VLLAHRLLYTAVIKLILQFQHLHAMANLFMIARITLILERNRRSIETSMTDHSEAMIILALSPPSELHEDIKAKVFSI